MGGSNVGVGGTGGSVGGICVMVGGIGVCADVPIDEAFEPQAETIVIIRMIATSVFLISIVDFLIRNPHGEIMVGDQPLTDLQIDVAIM